MGVAARRQREKEERRAAILQAAEKVFVNKGVLVATMDDIAHEAELSKGTLYLYFDSKDELYLEIAVRTIRELLDAFVAAEGEGGNGHTRLRRLAQAYGLFAVTHRDRFRVAVSWMTTDPGATATSERFAEYKRLLGDTYALVSAAIDAGKADGSVRADLDTGVLFAQLWGAILGVLNLQTNATQIARRMPAAIRLEDIVPGAVDLLLRAIQPNPAAAGAAPAQAEVA